MTPGTPPRAVRRRACAGFALVALAAGAARAEEIRIEVSRGAESLRLWAPDAALRAADRALEGGGGEHTLSARGVALSLDGRALEGPLRVQPSRGRLRLDGRDLPGELEVFAEGGRLVAVNTLDLEDYVAAVVSSEVPSSWPLAALQAQAVAARTFAVAQKVAHGPGARAHLGASVLDQVYRGAAHPGSAALKGARSTAGEVLTFGAAPIAAYFSASCGGRSESAEEAFHLAQGSTPYLVAGEPDDDGPAPRARWTVRIPLAQIAAALRAARRMQAGLRGLEVAERSATGRARTLRLDTDAGKRPLAAVELRQLLGYTRLPSLWFDVEVDGGVAVFSGRGSGHGVGLCQWGARARAARGESYRDILAHYYPGAEIRRMY